MGKELTWGERVQANAVNEVAGRRNQLEDKLREILGQLTCLKSEIKYYAYLDVEDSLVIRKGAGDIEAELSTTIESIKEVL